MMTEEQFYYGKLAEEASEVSQIALKIQQFGIDTKDPISMETNRTLLKKELNDLTAVVDELNDKFTLHYKPCEESIKAKKEKINKFKQVTIELGHVQAVSNLVIKNGCSK